MYIGIHEQASNATKEHYGVPISDRRLWAAVLLQAIEDWRSNNIRRQREAEEFFFRSESDFATVCRAAGFDPKGVLAKMLKMNNLAPRSPSTALCSRDLNSPATMVA